MEPDKKEQLIKKWLADELTDQELELFKKLDDYQDNLQVIELANKFKAPEFSAEQAYESIQGQLDKNKNTGRRVWLTQMLRVAAVLIFGVAIFYLYPTDDQIKILTSVGEKTRVILPDSSVVMVNAASEISYHQNNWEMQKSVNLQGEAFFEVVKGGSFDVVTETGTVSVLGTKFNVKQRDGILEVKCFHGKVQVTADQFQEILTPGANLRWADGQLIKGINQYESPQWTGNISSFQDTPLSEVFSEIERQYQITVEYQTADGKRTFTGGFVHDNLDNALVSITEPMNLEYRLNPNGKVVIIAR